MEHASTLDLYQVEDPAFYDQLERARRQTTGRIGLLTQLLAMGQDALTLLSLGAALFVYSPWLLLLLAVAVLPGFLGETHFAALEYSLLYRWTPERRQLDYSDIYEQSLYLKDLFDFFEMRPTITSSKDAPEAPEPIRDGFIFKDVGFNRTCDVRTPRARQGGRAH